MRSKIEQSGTVLDTLAQADKKIGDANFDIENPRIEDVLKQQEVMEGNIAGSRTPPTSSAPLAGNLQERRRAQPQPDRCRQGLAADLDPRPCRPDRRGRKLPVPQCRQARYRPTRPSQDRGRAAAPALPCRARQARPSRCVVDQPADLRFRAAGISSRVTSSTSPASRRTMTASATLGARMLWTF